MKLMKGFGRHRLKLELSAIFFQDLFALITTACLDGRISKDAAQGEGCDRHLLGLKLAAILSNQELPKLFKTKAYNLEYEVATSQTPIVQDHPKVCTPVGKFREESVRCKIQ